jgi:hypothetical protein
MLLAFNMSSIYSSIHLKEFATQWSSIWRGSILQVVTTLSYKYYYQLIVLEIQMVFFSALIKPLKQWTVPDTVVD